MCSKRIAAGRSGGIFDLSQDGTGKPKYDYQAGFEVSDISNSSGLNSSEGDGDVPIMEDDKNSSCDSDSFENCAPPSEATASPTRTDSKTNPDDESNIFKSEQQPPSTARNRAVFRNTIRRRAQKALSGAFSGISKRASRFKEQVKSSWAEIGPKQNNARMPSKYSVDLSEDAADDDETNDHEQANIDCDRSTKLMPGFFETHHRPTVPNIEAECLKDHEEDLHTEANFEFFCSFPAVEEEYGPDDEDGSQTYNDYKNSYKPTFQHTGAQAAVRDMRNHYEVLGLASESNSSTIASQARKLMSTLHPDKLSQRSPEQKVIDTEEFARVSLAKTELTSPELRILHDREIAAGTWTGVPKS